MPSRLPVRLARSSCKDTEIGRHVHVVGLPVDRNTREWLVAKIARKVPRPCRGMRCWIVSNLEHVPGSGARCYRVRIVARVRDEGVVWIGWIDVDAAHETRRLRRGIDAIKGDRARVCRVCI